MVNAVEKISNLGYNAPDRTLRALSLGLIWDWINAITVIRPFIASVYAL